MKMSKFNDFSLQKKITMVYIFANIFIIIANFVFLFGINRMSTELEQVYQGNLNLNILSEKLSKVQSSMTEYLSGRTSEALENCYRSEQEYATMVEELSNDVSDVTFLRMERDIKKMSQQYLEVANQTIEAKEHNALSQSQLSI